MRHGHPDTYDDAILESGNAVAKKGKQNLFWGGTDEADAKFMQPRSKRNADGELIETVVARRTNASIYVQRLENTFIDQTLQMRRGMAAKSEQELEAERVKKERFDAACKANVERLGRLEVELEKHVV